MKIGLVPAAGEGKRIGGVFKELLPFDSRKGIDNPRRVIDASLDQLEDGGVDVTYVITSPKKASSHMGYLGSKHGNMKIAYLCQEAPTGLSRAVDLIGSYIETGDMICFAMPDTVFWPHGAILELLREQNITDADLVLGLHKVKDPSPFGMVRMNNGHITQVIDKPRLAKNEWIWSCAVFKPSLLGLITYNSSKELSDIFDIAVQTPQFDISNVMFGTHKYLDMGSYDNYVKALKYATSHRRR